MRIAIATRSMNDCLYEASCDLLRWSPLGADSRSDVPRHRIQNTDNFGYFRELLSLAADWIISVDEDAFVLEPGRLLDLVQAMEQGGYAACGMPDGGVVPIRRHNPVACNAYFNVLDLRRVRRVWSNWERVVAAKHQPAYESRVADFAKRTTFAFDHFERYYGVFFSLLEAGERILYLDAETWQDGVSTLLKDTAGRPLLIHCWYTRHWDFSYHTRRRYQAALNYARQVQGLGPYRGIEAKPAPACPMPPASPVGKWETLYEQSPDPEPLGDPLTYEKAARFLRGLKTVEDWGCGWRWFRRYFQEGVHYRGVDGSRAPGVEVVADLRQYTSQAEGILLRHVLEHNQDWAEILTNALRSFTKRLVLVLSTPFADITRPVGENAHLGVPCLAFAKKDLIRHFTGLKWTLEENLRTNGEYGVEQVFYLERAESN
jgi:hypothetical protein